MSPLTKLLYVIVVMTQSICGLQAAGAPSILPPQPLPPLPPLPPLQPLPPLLPPVPQPYPPMMQRPCTTSSQCFPNECCKPSLFKAGSTGGYCAPVGLDSRQCVQESRSCYSDQQCQYDGCCVKINAYAIPSCIYDPYICSMKNPPPLPYYPQSPNYYPPHFKGQFPTPPYFPPNMKYPLPPPVPYFPPPNMKYQQFPPPPYIPPPGVKYHQPPPPPYIPPPGVKYPLPPPPPYIPPPGVKYPLPPPPPYVPPPGVKYPLPPPVPYPYPNVKYGQPEPPIQYIYPPPSYPKKCSHSFECGQNGCCFYDDLLKDNRCADLDAKKEEKDDRPFPFNLFPREGNADDRPFPFNLLPRNSNLAANGTSTNGSEVGTWNGNVIANDNMSQYVNGNMNANMPTGRAKGSGLGLLPLIPLVTSLLKYPPSIKCLV